MINKKNFSHGLFSLVCLLFCFCFFGVFSAKADVVANVNFDEKIVISQENNNFKIKFSISNGEQSQTGVRYSVFVLDSNNEDNKILDETVYNETIDLASNTKTKREINYSAPKYLKGEYELVLQAQNKSGMVLAMGFIGKFDFFGNGRFVEMKNCKLKIAGDKKVEGYEIYEGIDVAPDEDMMLVCDADNNSGSNLDLSVNFETRERSSFGDIIDGIEAEKQFFNLTNNQTKSFEIKIPKHNIPQAYEVELMLKDQSKDIFSNKVNVHYVLRGKSATIQNVSLDKSSYLKGENAKVSIFWSGSADNFLGSRVINEEDDKSVKNYKLTITDENDKNCINPVNRKLENEYFIVFEEGIIKDCKNPTVYANISDENGKIYDDMNFDFSENKVIEDKNNNSSFFDGLNSFKKFIIVLFLVLFFVVILMVIFRRKVSMGLFLLIVSTFIFSGEIVLADVTSSELFLSATGGIDKGDNGEYSPGENIRAHLSVRRTGCANYVYDGTGYGKLSTESSYTIFSGFSNLTGGSSLGSMNKTAPSTPGNYRFDFRVDGRQNCTASALAAPAGTHDCTRNKSADIDFSVPFRVVDPRINGACGSSNGRNFVSAPSSNLCSAGSASAVSGSGPWSWNCDGSNGGTTANCQAGILIVNGSCGIANEGYYSTAPSNPLQLCSAGNASSVSGSGPWSWSCNGINGGRAENCNANVRPADACFQVTPANDFNGVVAQCQALGTGWDLVTSRTIWGSVLSFGRGGYVKDVPSTMNSHRCPYDITWPENSKGLLLDIGNGCVGDVPKADNYEGICYNSNCADSNLSTSLNINGTIANSNSARSISVVENSTVNISWDVYNANRCIANGYSWGTNLSIVPVSGSRAPFLFNPPVINNQYTLTCYNDILGQAQTRTINVTKTCIPDLNPAWGPCDHQCGPGNQTRTIRYANCGTDNQNQSCNLGPCPVSSNFKEVSP